MKTQRLVGVDGARLIGLVAVVAGHVWTQSEFTRWIFVWHVPLFFIVSGYLWSDRRSFASETRQRLRTLALPYATWLVLVLVAFELKAIALDGDSDLPKLYDSLWGGSYASRPFTTFWFVSALFFAALLCKLVRRAPVAVQVTLAFAGLAVGYAWGPSLSATPLAVGMAAPCLFYVSAGIGLRWIMQKASPPSWLAMPLIALPLATVALGWNSPMDMKSGDLGTPGLSAIVAVLVSAGLLLASDAAANRLIVDRRVAARMARVTEVSLVLVLVHPVILWLLGTPPQGGFADFALALGVPVVLGLVLALTPLSPYLIGRKKSLVSAAP